MPTRVSKSLRRLMGGDADHTYVQVKIATGVDRFNQTTYGDPEPYQAHVERNPTLIRSGDGQELTANTTVHLDRPNLDIVADSLVVLPGGTEERVIWAETVNDRHGPHATVLYLE